MFKIKRCEYCQKLIRKGFSGKPFINIMQNKKKHLFCSQRCKLKWIFEQLKKTEDSK